mmetsp:Transcript_9727/g.40068  ORF Transcript_9727/g.40068 Transcript_9727/m.40068 type:complete len:267 (-) Transcript_9727:655-1455(-)
MPMSPSTGPASFCAASGSARSVAGLAHAALARPSHSAVTACSATPSATAVVSVERPPSAWALASSRPLERAVGVAPAWNFGVSSTSSSYTLISFSRRSTDRAALGASSSRDRPAPRRTSRSFASFLVSRPEMCSSMAASTRATTSSKPGSHSSRPNEDALRRVLFVSFFLAPAPFEPPFEEEEGVAVVLDRFAAAPGPPAMCPAPRFFGAPDPDATPLFAPLFCWRSRLLPRFSRHRFRHASTWPCAALSLGPCVAASARMRTTGS